MRIVILHSADALEPPEDPVLAQLASAIESIGHEAVRVSVGTDIIAVASDLRRVEPDFVFNLTESFDGVSSLDSNLAAMLNLLGLQYSGSSPSGLILAGDKSLTKKVLTFHGVQTPEFATVYRGALDSAGDIHFPLIVKPPQEDASIGITGASVVHDLRALLERIDALQTEFQSPVMVEEFIDGREFYVGILGNSDPTPLPVMELDFTGFPEGMARVATWDAKWGPDGTGEGAAAMASKEFTGTKSVFPTDLSEELVERMQAVAVDAYQALRLRDYARIDMRVTPDEKIYVIEVNPNCYLEKNAEFARSAAKDGMAYEALIERIMNLARARYSR